MRSFDCVLTEKTKVLKIYAGDWINQSRDKRELTVCRELGATVEILAKGEEFDYGKLQVIDNFTVHRCGTRPLGEKVPNSLNRIVSVFIWASYARRLRPNIITGHDLSGLAIGWISSWFLVKKHKPKLIYDSHELEMSRNANRNKFRTKLIYCLESFLIRKCVFSIVVNDSIADAITEMYRLKKRPIVVRSIPSKLTVDVEACKIKRIELEKYFPPNINFFLMYHGLVSHGRGIETLLKVISACNGVGLVIMGNSDNAEYRSELTQKANNMNIKNLVLFHEAVPIEDLWNYLGAIDVSMITISPLTMSYYYALPNKFFESIQATVPIIASDLPEMKRIIKEYNIGLTCEPDDVDDIKRCVYILKDNIKLYKQIKENMQHAKHVLCWEKEKSLLKKAYQEIISDSY